jgi:hypothetical protein
MAYEDGLRGLGLDGFKCAPAMQMDAQRQMARLQHETLKERLSMIEESLERLERRLWVAVYGVFAAVATQALLPFVTAAH